ncbi:MAG: pseudaminic acid synthase, partial [Gammaproteobacteria bacterium]|nr:pseudaminic acid synthase [Gammaproteobacteria bacterium]
GETITADHVKSIRPGYGLAPKYLELVLGKVVSININKGQPLSFEDIK